MSYKRILVPLDGSDTSAAGLKAAVAMAKTTGARLCLYHVIDIAAILSMPEAGYSIDIVIDDLKRAGEDILARASKAATTARLKFDAILVESAGARVADRITEQAKRWRADAIVIGTHGRRGLNRLLMGSDAELVVRNTTLPVILIHGQQGRKAAAKRRR